MARSWFVPSSRNKQLLRRFVRLELTSDRPSGSFKPTCTTYPRTHNRPPLEPVAGYTIKFSGSFLAAPSHRDGRKSRKMYCRSLSCPASFLPALRHHSYPDMSDHLQLPKHGSLGPLKTQYQMLGKHKGWEEVIQLREVLLGQGEDARTLATQTMKSPVLQNREKQHGYEHRLLRSKQ